MKSGWRESSSDEIVTVTLENVLDDELKEIAGHELPAGQALSRATEHLDQGDAIERVKTYTTAVPKGLVARLAMRTVDARVRKLALLGAIREPAFDLTTQ